MRPQDKVTMDSDRYALHTLDSPLELIVWYLCSSDSNVCARADNLVLFLTSISMNEGLDCSVVCQISLCATLGEATYILFLMCSDKDVQSVLLTASRNTHSLEKTPQ